MIYFFYGDPDLVSLKAQEVIEKFKKESPDKFEVQKINLKEEKIDNFLRQPGISLFGNQEVVLINNGEKLNKEEVATLSQIYQHSKEKHLIILARELKAPHPLLKPGFLKGCKEVEKIAFTEELLRKRIREEFSKQGKQASEKLIQVLIDLYGNNFSLIRQEIQKISLYFVNKNKINSQELRVLLSESAEELNFKFFKAIAQKDKKKAFRLLSQLVTHPSEAPVFLSQFLSRLRMWLKIKAFLVEGIIDPSLIAKRLNLNPYYTRHLLNESYSFSLLELEKALLEGLRLDYLLKTGKIAPFVVPAIFLVKLFKPSDSPAKFD